MESHKVELLAPAGNYDSFIGAINAGADAVYVGGENFQPEHLQITLIRRLFAIV